MSVQEEPKVPMPPRQPRRRYVPLKAQPRSRRMQTSKPKPIVQYQSSKSSKSSRDTDPDEVVEPRYRRLSLHLSLCNSVLGAISFLSAVAFGVITIVQAEMANKQARTANKEAKIANKIARRSLLLSLVQTCASVVDLSVS